jgi:ADP-ribose pyrophosphatase
MADLRKWQLVSQEEVFNQYNRAVNKRVYIFPNNQSGDYYIKDEGKGVAVLAETTDKKFILAKHYRPGPDEVLTELPGGNVDPGESEDQAAEREFLEETGYKGEISFVGAFYDDAYTSSMRYLYVAKRAIKVAEPKLTPSEQIEVVLASLKEFRQILKKGGLTDLGLAYAGLDYLGYI